MCYRSVRMSGILFPIINLSPTLYGKLIAIEKKNLSIHPFSLETAMSASLRLNIKLKIAWLRVKSNFNDSDHNYRSTLTGSV